MAITFMVVDLDGLPIDLLDVDKVCEYLALIDELQNKMFKGESRIYGCPEHGIAGVNFELMRFQSDTYHIPYLAVIWQGSEMSLEVMRRHNQDLNNKMDSVLDWIAYRVGPPYFTDLKEYYTENGYGVTKVYGDLTAFNNQLAGATQKTFAVVPTPGD